MKLRVAAGKVAFTIELLDTPSAPGSAKLEPDARQMIVEPGTVCRELAKIRSGEKITVSKA